MTDRAKACGVTVVLALLIGGIDQWLKGLVVAALLPDRSRVILAGILDLTYRQNTGAAFSLWPQIHQPLLIALNLLVLGIFLVLIWPQLPTRLGTTAAWLVLGGGLGNIIDRIRLHYVVDYLNFHVWPVFNLADACLVIGVGILLWMLARPVAPATTPGGDTP